MSGACRQASSEARCLPMTDEEEADLFANKVVQYSLAKSAMDGLADYLRGGRLHRNLPRPALEALFLKGFNAWAEEANRGLAHDPRHLSDVRAEYSLRGIEPPY